MYLRKLVSALSNERINEARAIIETIPETQRRDFILNTRGRRGGCLFDPQTYCKKKEIADLFLQYVDVREALSEDRSDLLVGSWYGKGYVDNIEHIKKQSQRQSVFSYG